MASLCWTLCLVLAVSGTGHSAAINKRPITAIQPISCTSKSGEVGVCMFAWHCRLFKGTHLTVCFDGLFVGSCCQLPPASTPGPSNEVLPADSLPTPVTTKKPELTSTPASATLDWRPVTSTSVVTSIPDQEGDQSNYSFGTSTTTQSPTNTVITTTEFITEQTTETNVAVTDTSLVNIEVTQSTSQSSVSDAPRDPGVSENTSAPPFSNATFSTLSPKPSTTDLTLPESTPTVSPIPEPATTEVPQAEITTTAPNKTSNFDQNYKEVCGKPRYAPQGRIVGGQNAKYAEWPWMISLRQWKKNTFLHKCGAALLNGQWAITAAHCVESVPASDILLRMGEYDVSNDKEPETYEERRVQIVASHHKFDPRTFEYDLALLRFYQPVRFRRNVLPICIPHGNDDFVGKMAYVTGWGRLYEDGPLPSVLQEVKVPVITNQECESMYKKAGFVEDIPDIFICAGKTEGGKDSCEGDSGGPMVLKDPDGRWVLAGIISWGIGCALPNQPGVYTRITKFANWIESIIVH